MRLIDADVLMKRLEDFHEWCRDGRRDGVYFVFDHMIPNTPTVWIAKQGHEKTARLINADALKEQKFPTETEDYERGWNDCIDCISTTEPTVCVLLSKTK